MNSGSIRVMIKYEAMAVITMELQLPIFSAFWISCSLASLLLMLIKKLPCENKIPTPAITKGNNIVPIHKIIINGTSHITDYIISQYRDAKTVAT